MITGPEVERHSTVQGEMTENGFKIFSYDVLVQSRHLIAAAKVNYLDLDYLKKELRENDTLVYVKKEIYFRK
ncbi:hypothetical protein [Proteiniphilum sp.]|uniref:hypothetical protein n=1 Tax=Proteiniphilum sp. TaxID=1926877 RepID=UPI002B1E9945|nr:hypothetical protein [Proteiniphilum sp.]MEA4916901.1 hypothetical protein [Proteiniphilum sp.]